MYEFKEYDAYRFSRHVGISAKEKNGQLQFYKCPYCGGSRENNNAECFGIDLKTGMFSCFRSSCKASGNMLTLSRDFDFSLGSETDEYYRPRRQFRRLKTPEKPIEPKPAAVEYLAGRGISDRIIKKYQITVQTDHPNILVFPFLDASGRMTFVKYLKTDYDR